MIKTLLAIAAITVLLTYTSCVSGSGGGFKSHEDSMRFAKAYYDKYPEENSVKIKYNSADSIAAKGFGPITWEQVLAYKARYDKKPVIYSPTGVALDGFVIDTAGYNMILANKDIKGLYLRLGIKDDGAYTLMTLGTDSSGRVMKLSGKSINGVTNGNSNFDNIAICPTYCPNGFE